MTTTTLSGLLSEGDPWEQQEVARWWRGIRWLCAGWSLSAERPTGTGGTVGDTGTYWYHILLLYDAFAGDKSHNHTHLHTHTGT